MIPLFQVIKAIEDPDEYMDEFIERSKPVVQALVEDVAHSAHAKELWIL